MFVEQVVPTIQTANEGLFFEQFTQQLRRVEQGDQILFCTMGMYPDYSNRSNLNSVYLELAAAAERNAAVTIGVCDYTRVVTEDWPDGYPAFSSEMTRKRKIKRAFLSKFEQAHNEGIIDFRYIRRTHGLETVLPMMGRNHIKLYGIKQKDRTSWWVGSANLHTFLNKTEAMINTADPDLCIALEQIFWQVRNEELTTDSVLQIKDKYKILVDAGIRGKSVIYDYIQNKISEAKDKVRLFTPTPLNGNILNTLIESAKRNPSVQYELILPSIIHKFIASFPLSKAYLELVLRTRGLTNISISHTFGFMHAKIAEIDETTLVMSHNLAQLGVDIGTSEIAIELLQASDRQKLKEFCEQEIIPRTYQLHPRKTLTRSLPVRQSS